MAPTFRIAPDGHVPGPDLDTAAAALALTVADAYERDPETWTQHDSAVNDRGCPVPAESPRACKWCALGAMARDSRRDQFATVASMDRDVIIGRAIRAVVSVENERLRAGYLGLHNVNDHAWTSGADAIRALRAGAALLMKTTREAA